MKTLIKLGAILALGAALALNTARANDLDYAAETGATIQFNGDGTFNFVAGGSGYAFNVSGDALGGSALGLLGNIGGTFTIGAITTVGPVSTAAVTGAGTFSIDDGVGNWLTADLDWVDILQVSTIGGLNSAGSANLSNISYAGSNATLLALANATGGIANAVTFQFTPAKTLLQLKTTVQATSFSGSLNIPDGGQTLMLLGLGLTGLAFLRRKVLA